MSQVGHDVKSLVEYEENVDGKSTPKNEEPLTLSLLLGCDILVATTLCRTLRNWSNALQLQEPVVVNMELLDDVFHHFFRETHVARQDASDGFVHSYA